MIRICLDIKLKRLLKDILDQLSCHLVQKGLDPESFQKLLVEFSRKNPGISLPSPDSFANVSIGIRHLRQEKGAKIVLPFGDHEYDCLLVPPPDPNLRKGFF